MQRKERTMTMKRIKTGVCHICESHKDECVEITSEDEVFEGLNCFNCLKKMIRRSVETTDESVDAPRATPLEAEDEGDPRSRQTLFDTEDSAAG